MSELKCCPFCGGEAEFIKYKESVDGRSDEIARVRCKCGVEMYLTAKEFSQAEDDFGYKGGYYSSNTKFWNGMHQRLIDKWNTRKHMDNILEKLEHSKEIQLTDCGKSYNRALDLAVNIVKQEVEHGRK